MIGTRLGSYEITAKLGEGGMGEVYRATDTKLKRDVAIKVLPQGFTEDKERLARFEREAQLLDQLNHPNIAAIYPLGKWGQLPISGAGAKESNAEWKSETVPIFADGGIDEDEGANVPEISASQHRVRLGTSPGISPVAAREWVEFSRSLARATRAAARQLR